ELYYDPISEQPVNIDGQKAHWLDATTIAWEAADNADSVKLFYALDNSISMNDDKEIVGGTAIKLSKDGELSSELKKRFRHLASLPALAIDVDGNTLRT
ncbi:hypothetical protein AB4189_29050, partial [Vibrio sp. 10N.286.49.E1]|uniref:hypothetical protein n=1 Tax=Vibrio sp. 10N.286.49.E1 TaxID=3229702 RepID=UPI00354B5F1E